MDASARGPAARSRPARRPRALADRPAGRAPGTRTAAARPDSGCAPWPPSLADDVEVGEARQHRLAAHPCVLERHRDLLVAARQLAGHHNPVAPAGMAHAIAIAESALAGDDRPRSAGG